MSQPGLHNSHHIEENVLERINAALSLVPYSVYILTSRYEQQAGGLKIKWVQRITGEPPMIVAAVPKGARLIPLMQDSHHFAICQINSQDKLSLKRFETDPEDAFTGLHVHYGPHGSPILDKALTWVECELLRHLDFEGDHDLYIGLIRDGGVLNKGEPIVEPGATA